MNYEFEKKLGLTPQLNKLFKAIPDESVLTPEDIAELLNRSKETVRRWCRKGKLPSYSFGGKYTILGNDFKKFMLDSHSRSKKKENTIS
ncbi:helix-turn-helix domain-containing protein [Neobacillus soli]|uniref:helix-turn-helix domain-containing protein n=1 Tax=Neobacillus soli TaxID=220688 RepID=UPI000824B138|nr:helix-turn-helix domain-containing protein [Neobacillus soli]